MYVASQHDETPCLSVPIEFMLDIILEVSYMILESMRAKKT